MQLQSHVSPPPSSATWCPPSVAPTSGSTWPTGRVQLPCVPHRCVYKRLLSVPKGTYEYCSMTALLANSPATACTVGRSGRWSQVAWCDYSTIWPYVVAWRSYMRLVGDKVHDQDLLLTCLKLDVVQAASNFLPFFFWATYDVLHDYKFTSPNIRTCTAHGEAPAIKVAITYCCTSIELFQQKHTVTPHLWFTVVQPSQWMTSLALRVGYGHRGRHTLV